MAEDPKNIFITPPEMAEALGVSLSTVYGYLKAGVIPSDAVGGKRLVHRKDFATWLAGGKSACHWLGAHQAEAPKEPVRLRLQVNGMDVVIGEEQSNDGRVIYPANYLVRRG